MSSSGPVVEAKGLGRTFQHRPVLEDIDLSVARGQVLGLLGPNGGGKSTLLQLMAGLLRPTSGSISVDGRPAHEVALTSRGRVGLITAEHGVYPLLSGRENLAFFGQLFGLSPAEVLQRCGPLVDRLGLSNHLDAPVAGYSSGMRQKLSLIRATFLEPALLLLDEPTANLDPIAAATIHEAVREQAEAGTAVVLVTHDLHTVDRLCDTIAILRRRLLHVEHDVRADAPPADSRLQQLYTEVLG